MGLRAVRPARRLAHGAPPRPRRGRAAARRHAWHRRDAGRAAARRAATRLRAGVRAVLDAASNVACAGGEPLGAHRLPQLRQPGEARDRLGARAGDRGDLAGGRGARHPGRLGQRLALQRDRRRARSRRRRSSAASASCAMCARIPSRWQRGDVVLLARARRPRGRGCADPLRLEAAPLCSLCPRRRRRRRRARTRARLPSGRASTPTSSSALDGGAGPRSSRAPGRVELPREVTSSRSGRCA